MKISVTAKHHGFTRPGFSPQVFQTQIGGSGFLRNADYTVQYPPYPMNRGGLRLPALPAAGLVSAGQAGHSSSEITKTS